MDDGTTTGRHGDKWHAVGQMTNGHVISWERTQSGGAPSGTITGPNEKVAYPLNDHVDGPARLMIQGNQSVIKFSTTETFII